MKFLPIILSLFFPPLQAASLDASKLVVTDSARHFVSYGGSGTCSNTFIRSLDSLGVPTCAAVALATDVSGILSPSTGGTGANNTAISGTFLRGNGTNFVTSTLTIPNTLTTGSVLFASGTNAVGQDNAGLFWDSANGRLGINSASPAFTLDMKSGNAFPVVVRNLAATNLFLVSSAGNVFANGYNFLTSGSFNTGAGGSFLGTYFQDQAGTKGYWDTGTAGINWLNLNRTTGNVNVAIRAAGSQTANLLQVESSAGTVLTYANVAGNLGVRMGATAATAYIHAAAGTTAASTSPLKFTSGSLNTTAEAMAVEALTDNLHFTITTGAARKGIMLDDGARLTSGIIPVATTNGRLIDGPTPVSDGVRTFDCTVAGHVSTMTITKGLITAVTLC